MLGLALEGGGARGAYHIGVIKAYMESGYEFDGFVGTSIGAINAAMMAQGDFDKAIELWENISPEQIFDIDEQYIFYLMDLNRSILKTDMLSGIKKAFTKIIRGRGVNTSGIKAFLELYIDEDKIRRSGKDFGLVTVSVNKRKPYELMLKDIPEGYLLDFIMASAALPGFQVKMIDENIFLDGALYNSCPVNLLTENGYDEVIAVRTNAPGVFRKINSTANVMIIVPSENLGNIMHFSKRNSKANIKRGYYDGLKMLNVKRDENIA